MASAEQPPNPEKKDKATQAPEIPPYTCYLCGHKSMQLTNHRRHMLLHHGIAGMVSLWSIRALMLGMANTSKYRELHSDN